MSRVTFAIIGFFGAALVLYWQVQVKRSQMEASKLPAPARPDFIANDLRTTEFNEQGLVQSRVSAKYMEHFQQSNETMFTEPVYLIYPENGEAEWQLSADLGKLNNETGKVVLENNVIIDAINIDEPLQSLTTTMLALDMNTMILTSDRQIFVTGSDFNIQGLGLYADLNAQELELLSQVEGTYEAK
ncbi:LPS export ABC transporter periplasmic protein LptC [Shewanella sp. 5_MG-2023]|uniref:LPS export ABC transporter periplasmic protein LptC n=1 Tax=unclassified Shewanella TaxID=196818 RepID=UPI0026E21557|nr:MULTISPECIES: LPS export ABC transporter periplasmic protein LptC [unclassified Shewanella]MDO6641385.1 LPS export ABC transporter periplasmic protein LptC [Shewanella sp. 5_MG-2023]MDO6679747.1 LPS export ABC transporter periplasmic protein LptC [Shewanella sp. 4_MG-2023]MDO6776698.1 LPS export ABC transporter periplasmic protein LptC [Shewanella sp. 3_MG-2023]